MDHRWSTSPYFSQVYSDISTHYFTNSYHYLHYTQLDSILDFISNYSLIDLRTILYTNYVHKGISTKDYLYDSNG